MGRLLLLAFVRDTSQCGRLFLGLPYLTTDPDLIRARGVCWRGGLPVRADRPPIYIRMRLEAFPDDFRTPFTPLRDETGDFAASGATP